MEDPNVNVLTNLWSSFNTYGFTLNPSSAQIVKDADGLLNDSYFNLMYEDPTLHEYLMNHPDIAAIINSVCTTIMCAVQVAHGGGLTPDQLYNIIMSLLFRTAAGTSWLSTMNDRNLDLDNLFGFSKKEGNDDAGKGSTT